VCRGPITFGDIHHRLPSELCDYREIHCPTQHFIANLIIVLAVALMHIGSTGQPKEWFPALVMPGGAATYVVVNPS
jgi:hypothetical protein